MEVEGRMITMTKKAERMRSGNRERSGEHARESTGTRRRAAFGLRERESVPVSERYSSSNFPAAEEVIPYGQRPATADPAGRCTIGWRATLEQDEMIRRACAKISPRRGGRVIAVSKAQFVEDAAMQAAAKVLGESVPTRRIGQHAARRAEACRILGIDPREWKRQMDRELFAAAADALAKRKN